jgi:hypothetical protein
MLYTQILDKAESAWKWQNGLAYYLRASNTGKKFYNNDHSWSKMLTKLSKISTRRRTKMEKK